MPLSNKQMEYLALAWQCFESEPKIDYDKFKEVAGLASAASARELMRVTKKKLKEEYGALSGEMKASNENSPAKKAVATLKSGGSKRGRKKKADSEDGNSDVEQSPSKKVKGNEVKHEPVEEDEDDGLLT